MSEKNTNQTQRAPRGPMGRGMQGGAKAKNFKGTWKKLFGLMGEHKVKVTIAIIFAVIGSVFTIIGPSLLADLTDVIAKGVLTGIDFDEVFRLAMTMVVLYVGAFLLSYFNGTIMSNTTQTMAMRLREQMATKLNKLPLAYFDSTTLGDTLSRVTNDVDFISQNLNRTASTFISSLALFFGSLIMMFSTNYLMALSAIVSSLIGFVVMIVIVKNSQKYFTRQQKELGAMNGHIEEIYSGHNIVKVYNGNKEEYEKFKTYNKNLYNSAWRSQFFSGAMMPLMMFVGNFGYVTVCVVGGALAFNGTIPISTIVSFMIYIRLFTNPLSQFAQVATALQSTAASGERIFELLEENEMTDESEKKTYLEPKEVQGEVEFNNVKFGYVKDKIIVNDFSTKIKAGQKIAIVGPTGAGKTTMVNLLMRFYELNAGEIKIDGVPTHSLTRENIHDIFCMVLQDTWLFEGTIVDNVIYSKKGATKEDVIKACTAVGIDHFVRTLPQGYDTVLSDNANISQGQKQLLTIARAMVENAPMLILDEATSSVDTRTEVLIQEAMDKLVKGRTSFVIAHRLSTIKNADIILVMKDGDILESGNHEELMQKGGFYFDLYNAQFA